MPMGCGSYPTVALVVLDGVDHPVLPLRGITDLVASCNIRTHSRSIWLFPGGPGHAIMRGKTLLGQLIGEVALDRGLVGRGLTHPWPLILWIRFPRLSSRPQRPFCGEIRALRTPGVSPRSSSRSRPR